MSNATYNNTLAHEGPIGWMYRLPMERHPLPFEQMNILWWQHLLGDNWRFALYIGAAYVAGIFALQEWMKSRPAMQLKMPLFWWNFGLGLFSIVGFARTAPGLLKTLGEPNGVYDLICSKTWMDTPIAFWSILFILSKPVELGDTLFTVLRKRPLVFVQWYHHLVTMLAVCVLGHMMEPAMMCYLTLNYGVHALMYPYFALKSIGYRTPKILADIVVTVEFVQMIVGLGINIASTYYTKIGENCARTDASINVFGLLYGSFLLLFGKLFYDSVFKSRKGKGHSGDGTDNGIILMSGYGADDETSRQKMKQG